MTDERLISTSPSRGYMHVNLRGDDVFEDVSVWVGNFIIDITQQADGGVDIGINDHARMELRGEHKRTPSLQIDAVEFPLEVTLRELAGRFEELEYRPSPEPEPPEGFDDE